MANEETVSKFQHAILEGRGFLAWNFWEDSTASKKVFARVTTPTDKVVDLDAGFTFEGEGKTRLFENNTFGSAGTSVDVFNWKRRSDQTCSATVQTYGTDSNITSTGTTVWADYSNGNAQGNQEVGGSIEAHGMMLKTNTEYVLEMENRESSAKDIFMKLSWEEDTP